MVDFDVQLLCRPLEAIGRRRLPHDALTVDETMIRYTVADDNGTVSFLGPAHVMKMLVAACARGAATLDDLLDLSVRYDDQFSRNVLDGLAIFDEHNSRENTSQIEAVFASRPPIEWPPFRVFNDVTRRASTQPGHTGTIVFNLRFKRIVQVQNSYAEILRRDRGRIREGGRPTRMLYYYDLPSEWSLVP